MLATLGRSILVSALSTSLVVTLAGSALAQPTPADPSTAAPAATNEPAEAQAEVDEKKTEETERKQENVGILRTPGTLTPDTPERIRTRGLLFSGDFGITRSSLGSGTLDFDKSAANGLLYGIGAGVRFGDLRLGARFRSNSTTEFTLYSVVAEVGYGIKAKPLEPILFFRLGYSWKQQLERATISGSLPPGNLIEPEVRLHNFLLGLELNALYHVNEAVRIGPFLGADLLIVQRDKVGFPQTIFPGQSVSTYEALPLYNETGHSVGYNLNLGIRGALDFGF